MADSALITGITGQDGGYLAELLLSKGYRVHALLHRDLSSEPGDSSGLDPRLTLHKGDLGSADSLLAAVRGSEPDEVYNLAAASHVTDSWERPAANADSNALGVVRLLEAIFAAAPEARFFQASSSEMFPDSAGIPQDEETPLQPRSTYGAAKAYGHLVTGTYRRRGLFACSGILFNHESPRRPARFVSRRVSAGVAAIKLGLAEELRLGNLDARRDWGYAPEYMEAAWAMMQADQPEDFVIGTGRVHSVAELVDLAFAAVDLESAGRVLFDPVAGRPHDSGYALADPAKARDRLGWTAGTGLDELVRMMVEADLERLAE